MTVHVICPTCGRDYPKDHPGGAKTPLQRARLELGWTMREAAARGGFCALSYISAMERGVHSPSLLMARRFSELYGKSVDELFPPEFYSDEDGGE